MQQLASSITSAAFLSNSTFPYLTNPWFEVSGGYTDGLSGIASSSFSPLVPAEERAQWEEYAVANQDWLVEGARLRKVHPQHKDPNDGTFQDHEERRVLQEDKPSTRSIGQMAPPVVQTEQKDDSVRQEEESSIPSIPAHIYRLGQNGSMIVEDDLVDGQVYAPVWQISPTPGDPSMVNFNALSDPLLTQLYAAMVDTRETVLSPPAEVDVLFDHAFDDNETELKKLPYSFIMEPVFSSFEPDASMVGFLMGLTAWENYFNHILPEGTEGIVAVVKDTCGTTISFKLNNEFPEFLGFEGKLELVVGCFRILFFTLHFL